MLHNVQQPQPLSFPTGSSRRLYCVHSTCTWARGKQARLISLLTIISRQSGQQDVASRQQALRRVTSSGAVVGHSLAERPCLACSSALAIAITARAKRGFQLSVAHSFLPVIGPPSSHSALKSRLFLGLSDFHVSHLSSFSLHLPPD